MPQHEARAPLAAHTQQGPGGMAKPAELEEQRCRGQANEAGAASPAAVQEPERTRLGQGEGNTTQLLCGNVLSACPMTNSGEGS